MAARASEAGHHLAGWHNKATPHFSSALNMLGEMRSGASTGNNGQVLSAQLPARLAPRGQCRCDHDQDRSNRNCYEPAHPVDPWAAVATERGVEVPAEDDTTDAAQDGQPERDVVSATRSNKLAEQADNDARDNHSDDLHISS